MNLLDDIKDIFHLRAEQLDHRLVGVEDHLSKVRQGIDYQARRLDFEIKSVRINIEEKATLTQLLTVPAGYYYELNQWTWQNLVTAIQPGLYLDAAATMLIDLGNASAKQGVSKPNELIVPEGETLYASDSTGAKNGTLWMQFKVWSIEPKYVESGTID